MSTVKTVRRQDPARTLSGLCQDCQDRCRRSTNQVEVRGELLFAGFRVAKEGADGLEAVHSPRGFVCLSPWLGGRLQHRKREGAGQLGTSEPLSCEERGGFCAVRTLSERCQNTVRTLSERCQNGQVSVRTGAGAPQTRFASPAAHCIRSLWHFAQHVTWKPRLQPGCIQKI